MSKSGDPPDYNLGFSHSAIHNVRPANQSFLIFFLILRQRRTSVIFSLETGICRSEVPLLYTTPRLVNDIQVTHPQLNQLHSNDSLFALGYRVLG